MRSVPGASELSFLLTPSVTDVPDTSVATFPRKPNMEPNMT